ncbi:Fatty-acid amide hydrolase 2 [Amphibalanus amphitrite]|uniref:Fatty-acid amide hydrolase 2 n=1 Tax=Amphibalanus amphitrite TaxID=1232801 RepID=A0A6A4WZU7_AMPAM|nr:Fatty-acid amide hydrolase 2 [Amphibalanus amphitrite]
MRSAKLLRAAAFAALLLRELVFYLLYVGRQLADLALNAPLEQLQRPAPPGLPPPAAPLPLSAGRLAHRIRTGQLTSQLTVAACIARLRQVEPQLHGLAEERFQQALLEARAADAELARLRAELPPSRRDGRERDWALVTHLYTHRPLLGVPFTVQETVAARGLRVRRGAAAPADSEAVAALRAAGAILLATTRAAAPAEWWAAEGDVRLPHDVRRVVGDGGAALVAAEATPLALGVGATLLVPAAHCGLFSHTASSRTVAASAVPPPPADQTADELILQKMRSTDNLSTTDANHNTDGIFKPPPQKAPAASEPVPHQPQVGVVARHAEDLRATLRLLARGPVQRGRLRELVPVARLRVFTAELPALLVTSVATREARAALHSAADTLRGRGAAVTAAELPETAHLFEIVRSRLSGEGDCSTLPPPARLLALLSGGGRRGARQARLLRRRLVALLGADGVLLLPAHPGPAPLAAQRLLRPLDAVPALLAAALQLPGCGVPWGRTADGLPLAVQLVAGPGADHLCLTAAEALRRTAVRPAWAAADHTAEKASRSGVIETDL